MSRVAVVILNYNGEKLLARFLPSVIEHSATAEIIVADNGSTDSSASLIRREFPGVKLIQLEKNHGFCGGYNRALAYVEASIFVLLNSDVLVTPGWLEPMLRLLETDPAIGAIQPKILSYEKRDEFEYAGAAGGFIDNLGYPFCRGRIFDYVEKDQNQYNDVIPVFWASGACLVIRGELFRRFGGFDEDFFAHMEEIDLCWKIQRAGYKVVYCGKSTVYHLGAGTLGYDSPRKTYLNFRNGLSLITKHFSTKEAVFKIPFRFLLDWLAAFVFLVKRKPSQAGAVLRAHWSYLGGIRPTIRKRRAIRSEYPTYPTTTIFPGVALFQYFVRGRRKLL